MDIGQLSAALRSPDVTARRMAAEQLSYQADVAPVAVTLVESCGDSDEIVREWAWSALEQMGEPRPADGAALAETLAHSSDADCRYWAVTLLGRLEAEAVFAVEAIANSLANDPAPIVQERAAWALGRIGPKASPALDALQNAAAGSSPRLTRLAEQAIRKISETP